MRIVVLFAHVCLALAGAEGVNFYAAETFGSKRGDQNPEAKNFSIEAISAEATSSMGTISAKISAETVGGNQSAQEISPPKQYFPTEQITTILGTLSPEAKNSSAEAISAEATSSMGTISAKIPVEAAGGNRSAQEISPPKQYSPAEQITTTLGALSADIQKLWLAQKDTVVKVMGVKKSSDGQENLLFGTGFFADQNAHVLTTATIATDAETLWVEYGELSYAATVIGKDPVTNIAVIQLLKKPKQFKAVAWPQTPSAAAAEGSIIVSIGSAFGMEPAPTLGLVAGKNIVFGDRIFVTTYLRSNIPIHGGESGAPVLSSGGDLCGMLIASLPELHASFSIPVRALERVFKDLISNKMVKYCAAGFSVRGEISEAADKEVVISAVDNGKIRYIGGEALEVGDVIRAIDGQKIVNESDIADILFFKKPNDRLDIQVTRHKKPLQVAITLSEKNF
ncbi:MAG: S1C family serine protease [Puniceicoccales bacterium]|jgi:S1-C subfamily serine protease|nr:S1C family serine protease [Puniceicoccales bacterium]